MRCYRNPVGPSAHTSVLSASQIRQTRDVLALRTATSSYDTDIQSIPAYSQGTGRGINIQFSEIFTDQGSEKKCWLHFCLKGDF